MKRDRFASAAEAASPASAEDAVAQEQRLECLALAAKMLGNRGAHEVLATAEVFVAYVRSGAVKVE